MTRTTKRYAGMPVVRDVNVYYVNGQQVPRSDALAAVMNPDLAIILNILTLDKSSPRIGVWTAKGLVYRQSTINGR